MGEKDQNEANTSFIGQNSEDAILESPKSVSSQCLES